MAAVSAGVFSYQTLSASAICGYTVPLAHASALPTYSYDAEDKISAINGSALAGGGGGTIVKSDLMWKPNVGSDGYVRWTLASSATTPSEAYISGAQGPAGPQGERGKGIYSIDIDSKDGLTTRYRILYTDNTKTYFEVKDGEKGDKGDIGEIGPKTIFRQYGGYIQYKAENATE
jgi:hypothetical protein